MEQKKKFEPFERIIVKGKHNSPSFWTCELYSHSLGGLNGLIYAVGGRVYEIEDYDILTLEGNEHLVGTSDMPEEEVELKEGDFVVVSDSIEYIKKGLGNIRKIKEINDTCICISYSEFYGYCIPFSQFNPNDLEETKKHILCVKNGKLVRAIL